MAASSESLLEIYLDKVKEKEDDEEQAKLDSLSRHDDKSNSFSWPLVYVADGLSQVGVDQPTRFRTAAGVKNEDVEEGSSSRSA